MQVVDLIDGGSKLCVNNVNKLQYVNALARYQLASRVKAEVTAFLKGFNDLVPDSLLSIFDENELEVSPPLYLLHWNKVEVSPSLYLLH